MILKELNYLSIVYHIVSPLSIPILKITLYDKVILLAPWVGIEPTTNRLTGDRSTAELPRNNSFILSKNILKSKTKNPKTEIWGL